MNEKICCFTGHRPEKLNFSEELIKSLLNAEIKKAIGEGFNTFISGMARGIDIWAAEIVVEHQKANKAISLICAIPYMGFEKKWDLDDKKLYAHIMSNADRIEYISEHYTKRCFQMRNAYMVDSSNRVIAFFSGEAGGTKNTINYARRKGIEVINICEFINEFNTADTPHKF